MENQMFRVFDFQNMEVRNSEGTGRTITGPGPEFISRNKTFEDFREEEPPDSRTEKNPRGSFSHDQNSSTSSLTRIRTSGSL